MSISKKVISIILTIIMIVTTCSAAFPVLATDNSDADFSDELFVPQKEDSEVYIVSEAVEKREENAKHFRMSDGSYIVAQYNTPVHFLDENGEWVDIDNTISEAQATTEQTALFGTDELYSTANGAENVVFAEKSNSNTLVSYEAKEYPISFNYQSAKKSYINVVDNENVLEGDEAFLTLTDIAQEVLYEDVFADVDLQYIVSPTGLKENIILKSKSAQNSFTVNYNIGELTAEVVDSNTICLMAGDEIVYTISAPYMTDADGEKCEAVTLTVEKNKNGKLRLVVSADENWLSVEGRAYPVVVDPILETEQKKQSIDIIMISDGEPNKTYIDRAETILGYEASAYKNSRVLAKFELPTLEKGDIVVGSNLALYNHKSERASSITEMQINAHEIIDSWDYYSVKWNDNIRYDSIISDYNIFDYNSTSPKWRFFDITEVVKKWYDGISENNGIMLKSAIEGTSNKENAFKAYIYIDTNNSSNYYYPFITVAYRNNKGLENYWTYTSLSAGGAGAAYINDYTGNLVFATNLISSSNELMPLSVDCVYNGYASDVKYASGKDYSNMTVPGCGWRLSVQQTLLPTSGDLNENYPYVYTDGDGTEHYIYKNTDGDETVLEDEDGLGLTLTVQKNGSTVTGYTLTDKKDNKLIFNSQGNLIKAEDANGNYNELVYDSAGKKLQKMIDGAGKEYTLTYLILEGAESSYIDRITDPSGRVTDFTYNDQRLMSLSFEGETFASFTYDSSDKSMLTANDADNYKLSFTYTSTTNGKQVASVTEYGKGDAVGQKMVFRRNKYNTTEIQCAGVDGVYGNSDDLITTYQFDNFGRTVTCQLKTADNVDSVAGVYNYTGNETTQLKMSKRVTSSAQLGANVINHIKNGNLEAASGWSGYVNDYATATVSLSADKARIGQKSLLVDNTELTSQSGNAYAYQDITGLTAGKSYTLSAYVNTESLTQYGTASDIGAYLALRVDNGDGTYSYKYSRYLDADTESSIDGGWRRLSLSVTLPEGVTSLRAYTGMRGYTGKAYFDCVQLEQGTIANDYNLLTNAGFEKYTSSLPDGWSVTDNITSGITSDDKKEGSVSMRIDGDQKVRKYLSQYVTVYGSPDDTYVLSGWAKADAVKAGNNHQLSEFALAIQVHYVDSDGESYYEYKEPVEFNCDISDWQYGAQTFTLASSKNKEDQPVYIRVLPFYNYQVNTCYFDNLQLIKDVAQSYVYDSEGNIVSVSANAEQKDNMEYDGENDLRKYTDVLGYETTYTYDNKHNVTEVQAPGGMKSEFVYNEKGQQEETYIKNSDGTIAIMSETEYTDDKAYVESVVDADGNTVSYSYDLTKGLVTSVANPKNVVTTYGYDTQDRLTSVSSGNTSVTYSYEGNRLESITYGSDVYEFVYDAYGNVVSTKVNGKALSTANYGANNGVLKSTVYGNGDARKYTYDKYGNLRIIENGSGVNLYSWHYDSSMTHVVHQDGVSDLQYNYSYDSIGRLHLQEITDLNTKAFVGATQFTYDLRNNVTKITNNIGGRTVSQSYGYSAISGRPETADYVKDNLPIRYKMSSSRYIDYTYDSLNRLTGKTLSLVTPLSYAYTYKASTRGGNYTTSQIATETIGGDVYGYSYDALGNITAITLNGEEFRSYEYDSLNQLKRENNKTDNKTYVYRYDNYGNITAKRIYDYTTTSSGTLTDTISYVYGADANAGWNSILTEYNGEDIVYDAIGNPITYRGATLEWDTRQLESYTLDEVKDADGNVTQEALSVTYKYDADGLRASKTVNGATTTYQYVSGKLMYESRDGNNIYYYYDSYGTPTAVVYCSASGTTNTAYIATNALGDVIGLYNPSGELLVKYEYDAWGNIIAETDANGNALTGTAATWNEINPFRYRGYYYDSEIGLYYLQSRYYDSETGRFINSDVLLDNRDLNTINPFVYCGNNPVIYVDINGYAITLNDIKNGIVNGAKKAWNWFDDTVIEPAKEIFNYASDVWERLNSSEFVRVVCEAVSLQFGAGLGLGASAEVGSVGVDAIIKGNPIDVVISGDKEESGVFYTVEGALSFDYLLWESYARDSYKVNHFTLDDVSEGCKKYTGFKEEYSFGVSCYFFIGAEINLNVNMKKIYNYLRG